MDFIITERIDGTIGVDDDAIEIVMNQDILNKIEKSEGRFIDFGK